jgi:hypothetical protein
VRRAVLLLLLVKVAIAQPPESTRIPPIDPKVEFKISLVGNRHEFHMGEIIPIKLSFSSRVKNRYQLNEAHYDRSGRMEYEHFIVTPTDGAVDPLANYERGMGGGLTGFTFLTNKLWTIQLNVNEWVRFTEPGEYQLKVTSNRVEIVDTSSRYGTSRITATSNEIKVKILPHDRDWEKRVYDEAVMTLATRSSMKPEDEDNSPSYRALETLRFLGTPEATRQLANQLRGESRGNLDFVCYIGLVTSPEQAVAREALEEVLADPDRPIDDTLLDTLISLERDNANPAVTSAEEEQKALEKVVAALPKKRDKALRVSLYAVLDHVWVPVDKQLLPRETAQKLVSQLISMFDQLSAKQQAWLLEVRWEQIKNPAVLPLLKRYAETDFSKAPRKDSYDVRERTIWALRRWYELDPAGARPAIIKEIVRPNPRFSSREVGFLPDATLPEVDKPLAEHLATEDFEQPSNVALLIARYATGAIAPEVIKGLDAHLGKAACDFQNQLLAFLLRVEPKLGCPRIERAIAARGKNFTACNHSVLGDISAIHYDPLLEHIAINALDDADREVAVRAAEVLEKFGSGAAETALWQRYEAWCKRWSGHESQLSLQVLAARHEPTSDLDVGRSFVRAIAIGKGWLTDEAKLQRLAAISKVHAIQEELGSYLKTWRQPPLPLTIHSCAQRLDANVAQYQLSSLDALKEKLSQFPAGTTFVLSPPFDEADRQCVAEVRDFLTSHGMSVAEEKRAP